MYRHCNDAHNTFASYLKKGKKPPYPYSEKWRKNATNPDPALINVLVNEDSQECGLPEFSETSKLSGDSDQEEDEIS